MTVLDQKMIVGTTEQESGRYAELAHLQATIPVRLVATPRRAFVTCTPDERVADVALKVQVEGFDHLPVVNQDNLVIGTLDAAEGVDELVGDVMHALDERYLIGATTSILEFLRDADLRPFRYVVDGTKVCGLVSLSDIQRLPVRSALFALITQLEMTMADRIVEAHGEDGWIDLLPDDRVQKLTQQRKRAIETHSQMPPILYTQFCDKATIIRESGIRPLELSSKQVKVQLGRIERLRNSIAHGSEFAQNAVQAAKVCQQIRNMDGWVKYLSTSRMQPV